MLYPEPDEVPQEVRYRLLLEARNRRVKPSSLGISRSFYYQLLNMERPVPSKVVAKLLEVLPDDAVLKADPVFFSNYIGYSKLDLPVDKLVQLLVDYIRKHPASAKILVSTLQKEAERLGLTGKVIRVTRTQLREFEDYLLARVRTGDLTRDTAKDYIRYINRAMRDLDYTLNPHNLRRYIRSLQATHPGVANHTYKALRLFVREVIGDRDLLTAIPRPRIKWPEPEAPPWSDICRVTESLPYASPPRVLLLFLGATGLRVETAYNLKLEALSLEDRKVWLWIQRRTKRAYFSFITPRLAEEMKAYLEYRETYLESLGRSSGKLFPFKPRRLKQTLYEAMDKTIGYRFKLKQVRKRFAEHLSHHLSTLELQVLMGHANREVVEKHYLLRDQLEDLQAKYDEAMKNVECL
ncbi:MAG: site-specific integrase [Desulfurococcales archaeon]|nr:site-specific integrase [Desulfurococcales archaeon]